MRTEGKYTESARKKTADRKICASFLHHYEHSCVRTHTHTLSHTLGCVLTVGVLKPFHSHQRPCVIARTHRRKLYRTHCARARTGTQLNYAQIYMGMHKDMYTHTHTWPCSSTTTRTEPSAETYSQNTPDYTRLLPVTTTHKTTLTH